jgi:hypothetical protein
MWRTIHRAAPAFKLAFLELRKVEMNLDPAG